MDKSSVQVALILSVWMKIHSPRTPRSAIQTCIKILYVLFTEEYIALLGDQRDEQLLSLILRLAIFIFIYFMIPPNSNPI